MKPKDNLKTRPCRNCPFRLDIDSYLSPKRKAGIAESILDHEFFNCHKANILSHKQVSFIPCKGAAKFLENVTGSYKTNITFLVHQFFIGTIDNEIPVYQTVEEFVGKTDED